MTPAGTNEPLDNLARRMDQGFAGVDADIRDLRSEMHAMRSDLGGQIDALRLTLLRVGGGMMIGLVGVIGAVLVSA